MTGIAAFIPFAVVTAFIVFGGIPTARRYWDDIKTEASERAVKSDRSQFERPGESSAPGMALPHSAAGVRRVSLNHPLPWLTAGGLLMFFFLFFGPRQVIEADPVPSRLAFSGTTTKSLDEVELCLSRDWGGALPLRSRKAPNVSLPTSRFDNPVRHFVVDVRDEGAYRTMRAYSRRGEPFNGSEMEALDGCLTGAALALGDPRKRKGQLSGTGSLKAD